MNTLSVKSLIYGTTIFIGNMNLNLTYGEVEAFTFQDIITKNYIIALVSKNIDINNKIYTRIHSSCVTSETLCSMDCDCVEQMYAALEIICKKGGIFFYFIQEGRGSGYIGKSRACMMVQHDPEKYNTFSGYEKLGMKSDYRSYNAVRDILKIFDIDPKFILLTNNPDKIIKLEKIGINIVDTQGVEVKPNSYNKDYLISKRESGHKLIKLDNDIKIKNFIKPVKPFMPYNLDKLKRFIFTSSYYLPIRQGDIDKVADPIWFRINIYYDIVNSSEVLVLDYDDGRVDKNDLVIRIQSESIFDRFPRKERVYKYFYNKTIDYIVENGRGKIIILYHDGKGYGLGNYVVNMNSEKNTYEYNDGDCRDYKAISCLLKYIFENENYREAINLIYNNYASNRNLLLNLQKNNIKVDKSIYIGRGSRELGHRSIINRIKKQYRYLNYRNLNKSNIDIKNNTIITGIGTSYSHAKYLEYLSNKYLTLNIRAEPLGKIIDNANENYIIFSQGLSGHIKKFISKCNPNNITLITSGETDIEGISGTYKLNVDHERETLIRVLGPLEGFFACIDIVNKNLKEEAEKIPLPCKLPKLLYPLDSFTDNLVKHQKLVLITKHPFIGFLDNIRMKFVEGCGIASTLLVDNLEFAHGLFQSLCFQKMVRDEYNFIIFNFDFEEKYLKKYIEILPSKHIWCITTESNLDTSIIDYEIIVNNYMAKVMDILQFNAINWSGKESQKFIYLNI